MAPPRLPHHGTSGFDESTEMAEAEALGVAGRWLTSLSAGIDGLILRGARAVIDRTLMPPPDQADSLRQSASFYRSPELVEEPRRFFAFLDRPRELPEVRLAALTSGRDPERFLLTFPSRYQPLNPGHRSAYAQQVENHTVRAELWRHGERRARGTVIGLHGFGMGYPRVDGPAIMASDFFAMGLDVVLFTLPLHGERTPSDMRFSGQAFASTSVVQINEAMGQAAHDIAMLVAWLRTRSPRPVGLVGLSLGGYVSALMADLLDDLDFVVPMVAPVCFGDLAFRFMASSKCYRDKPEAALALEEFRNAYRVHSPLTHARRLACDRLLIVAGRGDRIVPSEHPTWLWEHWHRPRIHWFSGSHAAPFGRRGTMREIRSFLAHLGIV